MNAHGNGAAASPARWPGQFFMPAEWAPHEATWLSWPHARGQSFPADAVERVRPMFLELVETLVRFETVFINFNSVADLETSADELAGRGVEMQRLRPLLVSTDEPWCRDHGPTFVMRKPEAGDDAPPRAAVLWNYNAWGGKYEPYDSDAAAGEKMANALQTPAVHAPITFEGGSIDSNGAGAAMVSASSVLNSNRNPNLTREGAEGIFRDYLGIDQTIWTEAVIPGDDTDGHVDVYARFTGPATVAVAVASDRSDPSFESLRANADRLRGVRLDDGSPLEVVDLPMPRPLTMHGAVVPATYANFYIANGAVITAAFDDPADEQAAAILRDLFPDREIMMIDARELVWALGGFHCLTQQVPAV